LTEEGGSGSARAAFFHAGTGPVANRCFDRPFSSPTLGRIVMRIPLYLAAAVALALPAFAQTIPPQQKNNDASVGGAITTKPPEASPIPERRDDTVNSLGRTGPAGGDTTTGSGPLPGESAIDKEIGMDDDKSEAERNRTSPPQRR
jgi:hypothetical protein